LCGNLVKFGRREIGKVVRYIPDIKKTKFPFALLLSLLHGSRPKSAMPAPDNVLRELRISSKSVHFRRMRQPSALQSECNIPEACSFKPNNNSGVLKLE